MIAILAAAAICAALLGLAALCAVLVGGRRRYTQEEEYDRDNWS